MLPGLLEIGACADVMTRGTPVPGGQETPC